MDGVLLGDKVPGADCESDDPESEGLWDCEPDDPEPEGLWDCELESLGDCDAEDPLGELELCADSLLLCSAGLCDRSALPDWEDSVLDCVTGGWGCSAGAFWKSNTAMSNASPQSPMTMAQATANGTQPARSCRPGQEAGHSRHAPGRASSNQCSR